MVDLLDPRLPEVAALLLFRVGAVVLTAPMFSARSLPMRVKVGVTAVLVLAILPVGLQASGRGIRVDPATIAAEATVGAVMGLAGGIFVAAAESAGDTLAVQMGLSGANVVDPLSSTQLPVLGQLLGLTVLSILLVADGHLEVVRVLERSTAVLPPGTSLAGAGRLDVPVRLGTRVFGLGLRFAAPVVAAMMLGNAVMGVLARAVPQLNVLLVAFPLQIGIGLLALGASITLLDVGLQGWSAAYAEAASELLGRLAPEPGGV